MGAVSTVSLALSLVFGVAQAVIGSLVVQHVLRHSGWRRTRGFVLLLVAAWFVCSGLAELAVSGMEAVRLLGGSLSNPDFILWRGRIDALLFAVTLVLILALLAYPIARRAGLGGKSH